MRLLPWTLVGCLAPLLLLLVSSGCGEAKGPERTRDNSSSSAGLQSDSGRVVSRNLPAGRFQIPTKHTLAPDLFISLPKGYSIKDGSKLPNDRFMIIGTDDPIIKDTSKATLGFLQIYIGANPESALEAGHRHTERPILFGGHPLVWKLWEDHLPDGRKYYHREIATSDFFAPLSPELSKAHLNLDLYVGGADSLRVDELMRAVETLALHP